MVVLWEVRAHARWVRVSCCLVEVTAADRAAATVRREGASADAVGVSSVMRFAHDGSLCGGNLLGGASCKASPERGGAHQQRAEGFVPPRWQVAAALSAAVTIAQLIGDTPTFQAEPTPKKNTPQTPAALRERGVWGERGFSQRSRLSPQSSLSYSTMAGRGGSVSRRDHSPAYRRHAHLSGGTKPEETPNPNASRSSGERGLGGEGLLSEKPPLPPESPGIPRKFHHSNGYSVTGLSSFLPFSLRVSRRLSMDVAFVRTVGVKSL